MDLATTRVTLPSGVTLKVQAGGPEDGQAIVLLHGFPESHRTWRHVAPELARDFRVIAPDQRGYGGSDRPQGVESYRIDCVLDDLFALADSYGVDRFTLVGHDWGGAAAWAAALKRPERLSRLVILNAPHPYIFQNSLIDHPEQRAASQYIRAFQSPGMERGIAAMGLDAFFEKSFRPHVDLALIPPEERRAYLDDWGQEGALTAMLNWYRASNIQVPAPDEHPIHPMWTRVPFPSVEVPTLVIWGVRDVALLPVQLEGLEELVDDLTIVQLPDVGHFVPWEAPDAVVSAIRRFMGRT